MTITHLFNFEARKKFLRELSENLSRADLKARLMEMADNIGHGRFRDQSAADIVASCRPEEVLPSVYDGYRGIVADGIRFLISRLSIHRIAGLIADQAGAPQDIPPAGRLLILARKLPTLHKLGQMIARNRHLDPSFKGWLTSLENGPCTIPMDEIRALIHEALGEDPARLAVEIGPAPIAEASVGVVVPFRFTSDGSRRRRGVFKVLKPGVRERLREELEILADLAEHLDRRRHLYPVGGLRFADTFEDIRAALIQEVDLSGEQRRLGDALRFYRGDGPARVPGLFPFSTPEITAMEFMPGEKITDAPMAPEERKRLARDLFRTLIWQPLFSLAPLPPFHGDPHAGNLLAQCGEGDRDCRIGLIDWSLSGTLPRDKRSRLVLMMLGILMENREMILDGIQALSADDDRLEAAFRERALAAISGILSGRAFCDGAIARKAFVLLDGLAIEGFRFPRDLLLFRKSFFTLEGVLFDLCPSFDVDEAMMGEMAGLILSEAPQRWASWIFPFMDRPENYRSLVSNMEIRCLAQHFAMAFIRRAPALMAGAMDAGLGMLYPFFLQPIPR
ncbi:AarF/UbiB family protein [Desulfococcus sp.]|uniref:AarF/UbiB family protein n=1 Tax=Desulfococcus sp. TaxID=2025834 RepID=UPI00359357DB